ncbi:hypothetical protein GYH30_000675 [Glycine max]|uniref:S-acyltransferase n=1 Tax=Glycine max TaxID=3847 RepID=K7K277_SOYBN|nr:hypothetical protein GYH30_000675 [Glycine max]
MCNKNEFPRIHCKIEKSGRSQGEDKIYWRFIFGPDVRSLALTIILIVAPVTVFCVFVARKLMDAFFDHWGISIMVLVLLLLTSGRDPGIIPRNAHPPEPEGLDSNLDVGAGQTPQLRLPHFKEVEVNGIPIKVKYCDTCMLYRPPRCSHCSICNNCVERFDHHYPWVGQCIGLRNYRFFFMFVFSTTLLCIYIIMALEETTIWKTMIKTPSSIVLIIYTFISMWFVGGLTTFHLYLISTKQIFYISISSSKNNFKAMVPREPALPTRSVGGGFMNQNMGKAGEDIKMGRKIVWDMGAQMDDNRAQINNDRVTIKDGELSPEIRTTVDDSDHAGMHPTQSSWGRKSGSWEMSLEVLALIARVGNQTVSVGVVVV